MLAIVIRQKQYHPKGHKGDELHDQATYLSKDREADLSVLVHRCAAGDTAALRDLYVVQASRLYVQATRITNDPDLAADAVHDTFVRVWKYAASYDAKRGNAGAWLNGIVCHCAIDIRRPRTRETLVPQIQDQVDEAPDALNFLIGIAEASALHRSLALLQPIRRQMLMSAYVDGLSREDIAAKYDVPLGTAKSWIRRALAQLKRHMEHKEPPEPELSGCRALEQSKLPRQVNLPRQQIIVATGRL